MNSITLTRPDDWHLHLRDGAALAAVVPTRRGSSPVPSSCPTSSRR
jgi:dihydroorotase